MWVWVWVWAWMTASMCCNKWCVEDVEVAVIAWPGVPTAQVSKRETRQYLNTSSGFNPAGLPEYHQVVQDISGYVRRAVAKRDPVSLPSMHERMVILNKTLECERDSCATKTLAIVPVMTSLELSPATLTLHVAV